MDDQWGNGFVAGFMLAGMLGIWELLYFTWARINRALPNTKENGPQ